ncbi:MAG: DNA mismatch repair protein MutS [Psychroflexus sp.]|nr:DNA mismatch repair protein MutS [Psychroflexus sp.]MDN6310962.1 DNA mismatch repair protein MutS [Psychroflexus sp.]
MIKIKQKTLQDLEFDRVRIQLSEFCVTDIGHQKALDLKPFHQKTDLLTEIKLTEEYKSSEFEEKPIPNHGFEAITEEVKLLQIEGSKLELLGFRRLNSISQTTNTHLLFFKKFQELYPQLYKKASEIEYTEAVVNKIKSIINRFGEIRDDASPQLQRLRREINFTRGKLSSSFSKALAKYNSYGYLSDIKESLVDNVRVLAVPAMHKRKVKGSMLGSSKSGNIIYIQPEETHAAERDLGNLMYEEKEEINKILKELTEFIRPFAELFLDYQDYLSAIDVIAAKIKYAELYDGLLPKVSDQKEIYIKDAYHPLLLINHNKNNKKTYSQDISLNEDQQIIVISGPNAGGKSITLKTVGLLQVMYQSAMPIPVHEYSRMSIFDKVLTDIGDNQSIENHLSTYSYRLKNMRKFIKTCDAKTMFLIDEFGTGTDPELGGALAETFLEVFHEKGAYGIITTHYANLKTMANENPAIVNANMMFDNNSLEPIFKLKLGEAGSSFTFEVAQKNGIPYSIINRSKKKVERGKIRFDKSIAKLQQERSQLTKTKHKLETAATQADDEQKKLDEKNARIQQKLESYQELYDSNQRLISMGEKVNSISQQYFNNKDRKQLISHFLKLVEKENSKRIRLSKQEEKKKNQADKKVKKEVEEKVEHIRTKKKKEKEISEKDGTQKQQKAAIYEGDSVRIINGRAVGTIEKFEKDKAIVNYGMFTTSVSPAELELVKRGPHGTSKK